MFVKNNWQSSLKMQRVVGDIKITGDSKIKTGACSNKNGCGTSAKLLEMDLVAIKMS